MRAQPGSRCARSPAHAFLSTFSEFACWGKSYDVSCPGRTDALCNSRRPGNLGALSAHLVKPPQTENDAPENVISPGWGVRGTGLCDGHFGFALKMKENKKPAVHFSAGSWECSVFIGGRMPRGLPGLPSAKPSAKPSESACASSGTPRYFFILSLPFSDRRARLSLERDWHRLAARHLTCRVLPVFPFPWTTPRPNVTAAAPRCLPVKSPQQRPCPAGPEASAVRSAIPVPSAVTFRESKPASTGWVFPGLCWHRRHENPRD